MEKTLTPSRPDEVRYRSEKEFHDRWAKEVNVNDLDPLRVFISPVIPESRYSIERLGELNGKRILDLGCGYGETSVYLALQGARVDAVDISPEMIRCSETLARKHNVAQHVTFSVQNAEKLDFEDGRFDLVYGQDVLHHTQLEKIIPELHRVLRAGGKGSFSEPLGHNWIINFLRDKTPEVRTEDEHPLKMKDIALFRETFRKVTHREFHFSTLSLLFWFQVLEWLQKGKEGRAWKRIIEEGGRYQLPFRIFSTLDRCLFSVVPFLKRYCRMTVISFEK